MKPIKMSLAAEIMEGRLHGNCGEEFCGVCTDSRRIQPMELFFALTGDNFDGHDFVQTCLERGAAAAVVRRQDRFASDRTIHVDDPLRAYQLLAGHYRRQFSAPIVGITGSHGKTTTKDLIGSILRTRYNVLQTHENNNGLIGVPMTIFRLRNHHEAGVIEIGISKPGEMDLLAPVLQPDIALITCAASTHTEFLKTVETVAWEKSRLLDHVKQGGIRILNADDPGLESVRSRYSAVTYGIEGGDFRATIVRQDALRSVFEMTQPVELAGFYEMPLPGRHNVLNAVAALCVAHQIGCSADEIRRGLSEARFSPHRCRVFQLNRMTIIDDCYNAAPASVRSNLTMLREIAGNGRTVAVLGDMLELGDISDAEHRAVGRLMAELPVDIGFFFGERMKLAWEEALTNGSVAFHFETGEATSEAVATVLREGDTVLIKASRSMHAERILEQLIRIFGKR